MKYKIQIFINALNTSININLRNHWSHRRMQNTYTTTEKGSHAVNGNCLKFMRPYTCRALAIESPQHVWFKKLYQILSRWNIWKSYLRCNYCLIKCVRCAAFGVQNLMQAINVRHSVHPICSSRPSKIRI